MAASMQHRSSLTPSTAIHTLALPVSSMLPTWPSQCQASSFPSKHPSLGPANSTCLSGYDNAEARVCVQLFARLPEALEPLVFEIPAELMADLELLKQLGASETVSVARQIELLQVRTSVEHARDVQACCYVSTPHLQPRCQRRKHVQYTDLHLLSCLSSTAHMLAVPCTGCVHGILSCLKSMACLRWSCP